MTELNSLSDARYQELFERIVLSGHYSLSDPPHVQVELIRLFGNSLPYRGVNTVSNVEPWEAEQFRRRAGDLQHELGPPSLTDHLQSLNLSTTNSELRRFFARTEYSKYPRRFAEYRIPIRATNGKLHYFNVRRCSTQEFREGRDVDRSSIYEACGWPKGCPIDFDVPSDVVTCLKPLDGEPRLIIVLGLLTTDSRGSIGLVLVWFLAEKQYGVVFDYTDPPEIDIDEQSDGSTHDDITQDDITHEDYRRRLVDDDIEFSMAILDGQYRLGDGRDPEAELATQEDQDITFALIPFAFKGFSVEDACRYQGVIQPLEQDVLMKATTEQYE